MSNSSVEVILKSVKYHPYCPHGPTLMFERYTTSGKKTGRKFYACSACRNRTECKFFHWVDDKVSANHKEYWQSQYEKAKPPFTPEEYMSRLAEFKELHIIKRKYCKTCSMLLLPGEDLTHEEHEILGNIIDDQLLNPTHLFAPVENKKAEAQYFFTEKTVDFIVTSLKNLGFSKVVSIGTPRIHEYIIANESCGLTSLLLDIDYRYMGFYNRQQFCHYNLFNNHFFNGSKSKKVLKTLLWKDNGKKVVVVIDPPFGGLIDVISHTLHKISTLWRKGSQKEKKEHLPLLWFFPYFNESRILHCMPHLRMMDYKVEYANHRSFGFKGRKQGSPVRIFTNINPSLFVLPEEDGYKFCNLCQRYVSQENYHCPVCQTCTTKDGKTFKHCSKCERCVKSSYQHCPTCDKCIQVQHSCGIISRVGACYLCSGLGHKRRDCPQRNVLNKRKKRKLN